MCDLRNVLDKKNYRNLIRTFGGQRIWVPKKGNRGYQDENELLLRNARIVTMHTEGKSVKELSRLFDLSPKRLYGIINNYRTKKSAAEQTAVTTASPAMKDRR